MSAAPSRRRARVRRASLWTLAVVLAAAALTWALARESQGPRPGGAKAAGVTRALARPVPDDHPRVTFADLTRAWGVGPGPARPPRSSLLPEDMGSGAALEDFDGDGDLDLFLVGFAGRVGPGDSAAVGRALSGATHRLFRNDGGRFADVSAASGLAVSDFGMGVAAGDVDGDGLIDLYVTAYGPNRLFRNLGGLRFEDVTAAAGVGDECFGAGAAFADVDRDGDLDLYVCNYVHFRWDGRPPEASRWGGFTLPYTLNPSSFPPAPNRFYRNRGDGTFEEQAAALGIDDPKGRSLAAVFADFSGDGWPDLYVLNDVSKNAYFEGKGDGTFADRSVDSLAADYRGAMGNAVADFDGDQDLDLFITHWIAQENGLYKNLRIDRGLARSGPGPAVFSDEAELFGLGQVSLDYVGWGTAFFDYDLDGVLDLAVVNGSTMESEEDARELIPQRPLLFWQKPGEGFFEVGTVSGAVWTEPIVGRGFGEGDLDQDGDLDLVVTINGGGVRVLRNDAGGERRWIRVALREPSGNRFAVGAQVRVRTAGRWTLQEVGAGTSYLCHRPLALTFGLGGAAEAERVEVRWPDGAVTVRERVPAGTVLVIEKERESAAAPR